MSEFDFNTFVRGLSQEKLAELVIKFAPETYREEISFQHLNEVKANVAFDRTSEKIKHLFEDEELLYEPSDFEANLVGLSERLAGLWDRFPKETGQTFLFCFQKIEEVQDDGLLFRHYPEEYFYGESFLAVVQRYAATLPIEEKMEFVEKLETELEAYSYDTFSTYVDELHLIFNDSEKIKVKNWFFQSLKEEDKPYHRHYYKFLKDKLNLEEREFVLVKIYHKDKTLCLDLAETLVELKKPETAIQYLEALRESNPNPWVFTEEIFLRLIELKKSEGKPIEDDLISGLLTYKTNTLLKKSIEFCPERSLEMESVVKSASHYYFLKYLINKNRIDEAHQLVLTSKTLDDQSVQKFYNAYCNRYPEDSTDFYTRLITKELPYTGDHHYEAIVSSLHLIKKVNPQKTHELVEKLRKEYKRRRNLMTMLEREF